MHQLHCENILGSNPSQDRSFVCSCGFPLVIKALGKVAHCSLNAEHQFHNVEYCILLLLCMQLHIRHTYNPYNIHIVHENNIRNSMWWDLSRGTPRLKIGFPCFFFKVSFVFSSSIGRAPALNSSWMCATAMRCLLVRKRATNELKHATFSWLCCRQVTQVDASKQFVLLIYISHM